MKKSFLFAAFAAIMTLVGCSNDDNGGGNSGISLSPSSLSVSADATDEEVSVKAGGEWLAVTEESWIELSKSSGAGDATVTIEISKNRSSEARTGEVIFACGTSKTTLTVEQEAGSGSGGGTGEFFAEVVKTTSDGIFIDVDPGDYDGTWFVMAVPYDEFISEDEEEGYMGDKDYLAYVGLQIAKYAHLDVTKPSYPYVYEGAETDVNAIAGWGPLDGTKYAIAVFGNDEYEIATDVILLEASTELAELSDFTLDCQFSNITATGAEFTVKASDETTFYIFSFLSNYEAMVAELGLTEPEIYSAIFENALSDDGTKINGVTGSLIKDKEGNPYTIAKLSPSTEYSFVGYGIATDEKGYIIGRCTDAQVSTFTTANGVNAPANAMATAWSTVNTGFGALSTLKTYPLAGLSVSDVK